MFPLPYNQALYTAAKAMAGSQYWSEACARAVSDVFRLALLPSLLPDRSDWVPDWAQEGQVIDSLTDLRGGDVVIYNWDYPTPPGADTGWNHIGIYAGDGQVWNVSSEHGHQFVATPIPPENFQTGRRMR